VIRQKSKREPDKTVPYQSKVSQMLKNQRNDSAHHPSTVWHLLKVRRERHDKSLQKSVCPLAKKLLQHPLRESMSLSSSERLATSLLIAHSKQRQDSDRAGTVMVVGQTKSWKWQEARVFWKKKIKWRTGTLTRPELLTRTQSTQSSFDVKLNVSFKLIIKSIMVSKHASDF